MLRESIPADGPSTRAGVLEELVDAVIGDDVDRAEASRARVVAELGWEWLVDACAVIANFEMMTRLADGTGARLRPQQLVAAAPMIDAHGLRDLPSART